MKIFVIKDYNISTHYVFTHIPESRIVINTLNPHSLVVAQKDTVFKRALMESDILIPDGVGIVLTARLLWREHFKKLSGYDLQLMILKKLDEVSGRCFYLGASDLVINKIKSRISMDYPNIQVEGFAPPYKCNFTNVENQVIIGRINEFRPDVLFIGMTAPKQEKWVYEHKSMLHSKVMCSIGGAFDFYAGTIKLAPRWMRVYGLEWLSRLVKEPRRMWKRNFVSTPLFIFMMLAHRIGKPYARPEIKAITE